MQRIASEIADRLNTSRSDIHEFAASIIKEYDATKNKSAISADVVSLLAYLIFAQGYSLNENFNLIRARKIENRDQVYMCPCQLGFPHHSNVNLNRANKKNEAILYLSTSRDCAIEEMRPRDLKAFCEISYRVKTNQNLTFIPIGELDHLRRYGRLFFGNEQAQQQIELIYSKLRPEVKIAAQLADAFFADHFLKKTNQRNVNNQENATDQEEAIDIYTLTSALTAELLTNNNIDSIAYSSATYRGGINFAVKPKIAKEKLLPINYQAHAIHSYFGYGILKIETYAQANALNDKGEINWNYSPFGNARTCIPPDIPHEVCPGWTE